MHSKVQGLKNQRRNENFRISKHTIDVARPKFSYINENKMNQLSKQLKAELATVVNVMKKLEYERDTLTVNMNGYVLTNNTITNEIEKIEI